MNTPISKSEATCNIVISLLLSLVTFGIYLIYWQYKQMKVLNAWLGRKEFHFGLWCVLSLVTFGLYFFYIEYKMGLAIVEIEQKNGWLQSSYLPLTSLILAMFSGNLLTNAIQQIDINRWYEEK